MLNDINDVTILGNNTTLDNKTKEEEIKEIINIIESRQSSTHKSYHADFDTHYFLLVIHKDRLGILNAVKSDLLERFKYVCELPTPADFNYEYFEKLNSKN